jgi:hypothetical protein
MTRTMKKLRRDDRGMSTAEYAVGTVAACSAGGLLLQLLSSDAASDLLWRVINKAFEFIF